MANALHDIPDRGPEHAVEEKEPPWARWTWRQSAGNAAEDRVPRASRWRHWIGRAGRGATIGVLGLGAFWYAIHGVPGFGPAIADGVRAIVGPAPVAWAEDLAYGVADRVNLLRYGSTPPKTFWESPPPLAPSLGAPPAPAKNLPASAGAVREAFAPPPFAPPFDNVAAAGDGVWVPHPTTPGDPPVLWKTVVHPDSRRGFAAVALVAIDLERVNLHLVAGTEEPMSMDVPKDHRHGLVPADQAADLLAAFNGGFKAMHGHYGMMLDGETFLPPRPTACTIALYRDGSVRIRTWPVLQDAEPEMTGYRQTPPCLVEQGELNMTLSESNRSWGATVSGETIIRRSALGLDKGGRVLFYGIGEAVSSRSIAHAMQAAGAYDAAQLDVNHAYPRFLLYDKGASGPASSLIPDVAFRPGEYVADPAPRDFFYLARRRSTS